MEIMEQTLPNNAGMAKRAIQRMLDKPPIEIYECLKKAGLKRSDLRQIEGVLDSLSAIHALNSDPLEEELRPRSWTAIQEAANSDGWLRNEYHEYDL